MTFKKIIPVLAILMSFSVAACGSTKVERGLSGAALGAGLGTGIGALAGGADTGAAIGAGTGLLGGVLTEEADVDFNDLFDDDKRVFGRDADE